MANCYDKIIKTERIVRQMFDGVMDSILEEVHEYSTMCFLHSIMKAQDGEVYTVVYTDDTFQILTSACVNKNTLAAIPKTGLITNFAIIDDYLRCDAIQQIKVEVPADQLLWKKESVNFRFDYSTDSFFSLLNDADNLYYVDEDALLPNEGAEQVKYRLSTYGHTCLKNLKFSRTTMTAYLHVITEKGLENRNIVYLNEQHYLQMNEFIVGNKGMSLNLPEECAEFLGEAIDKEGNHYTLYRIKIMSLYDNVTFPINSHMINLCCYMSLLQNNSINLLDAVIDSVAPQEQTQDLEWAGGSNSHKSFYGVLFKSDAESFSKSKCSDLIYKMLKMYIEPAMSKGGDKNEILQEVLQEITSDCISHEEKTLRALLANILILCETPDMVLATAIKYKKIFQDKKFYYDKFLYWIRCYLYLNKKRITVPGHPVIHSNFIKAGTMVEEGIYYGEN